MKPRHLTAMVGIILLTALVGLPIIIVKAAPYRITTSECLICGRIQTVERHWMQAPQETIETHKQSLWMDAHIGEHTEHWWSGCSSEQRTYWFGRASIGCGGIGGVSSLHYLAEKSGEDVAAPFIEKYLQLIEAGDRESIESVVRNDVQTAWQ